MISHESCIIRAHGFFILKSQIKPGVFVLFTASTNRSFTPCWQRDVSLWAMVLFKVWTEPNHLFKFTDYPCLCPQYFIHPFVFVFLLWILFRRWRGGTGTRPSTGGLWNLWSCPGWSTPAVLTWSPKATCMVRWLSACTPDRYDPHHKPEFIHFLVLIFCNYIFAGMPLQIEFINIVSWYLVNDFTFLHYMKWDSSQDWND